MASKAGQGRQAMEWVISRLKEETHDLGRAAREEMGFAPNTSLWWGSSLLLVQNKSSLAVLLSDDSIHRLPSKSLLERCFRSDISLNFWLFVDEIVQK